MKFHATDIKPRESLTLTVLKVLSLIGEGTLEIIAESFLPPKYSFTKPTRALLGLDKKYKKTNRRTLSVVLSRLRREGLVEKIGVTKNTKWHITHAGRQRLNPEVELKMQELPKEDGKLRIVTFDIPEKEKAKREWLRWELVSYGYRLLHKSVWIGKRPMPQSFLEEIESMGLMKYLHIFEISRRGTLTTI